MRGKLQGPCSVGSGAQIVDSKIGPNVAVGDACRTEGSQIRSSILMDEACTGHVNMLCDSIVGRRSRIASASTDVCYTALVGDDSFVSLSQ